MYLIYLITILFFNSRTNERIEIEDVNFEKYLVEQGIDSDKKIDGKISKADIIDIKALDLGLKDIHSLNGIESFEKLRVLNCSTNSIRKLDISRNKNLEVLVCDNNLLDSLDISQNINLVELNCRDNKIKFINLQMNPRLNRVDCSGNLLKFIEIPESITILNCSGNEIQNLDIRKALNLTSLGCHENKIEHLEISNHLALTDINCSDNPLKYLDLSKNINLFNLHCDRTNLTKLDLSQNPKIEWFSCKGNIFSSICVWDLKIAKERAQKKSYGVQMWEMDKNIKLVICK